jgi:hypothetical protein
MNTPNEYKPTLGSKMPFCDTCAYADFSRAKAFHEAWKMACRYRAPKALRAELRGRMRGWAKFMVEGLRRAAARDEYVAERYGRFLSQPQNGSGFHEQTGHGTPVAGTAGLSAA